MPNDTHRIDTGGQGAPTIDLHRVAERGRSLELEGAFTRFFYSLGTEYMDYDGDGDDEIVEVTLGYQPVSSGKQRTTAYVRVFDARFGMLEKSFSLWHFTTRKNANL